MSRHARRAGIPPGAALQAALAARSIRLAAAALRRGRTDPASDRAAAATDRQQRRAGGQ